MPHSILSVAYPFSPVAIDPVGGAEQILAQLDRMLVERGHRSTVIAAAGSRVAGHLLEIPAVRGVIDETSRSRIYSAVSRAIGHVLEHEDVDVIHLHGVDSAGYLPDGNVPRLITLHLPLDHYPLAVLRPQRPGTWLVPVSASQARTAAHPQYRGVRLLPPIENGVELPPRRPHAPRSYALAMGRVCPEKNHAEALLAAIRAQCPLFLAGQVFGYPEHRQYFDQQIRPKLDSQRRWLGAISGARKRRLLAGARCVLIPSRIAETSSLVAMEALAAGAPVIAYRAGALPDIVEHGRTGFIVEDVESMAEAIHEIGRIDREVCREAARERFALGRMTAAYLKLYERLASRQLPSHSIHAPGASPTPPRADAVDCSSAS